MPILLGILAPLFLKIQMYKLSENTYHIASALCHQSSFRSFWIAGAPMAICSRDFGVYLGLFTVSCCIKQLYQWVDNIAIGLFFISPLLIEKFIFIELQTSNLMRFSVGFLAGFGINIIVFSIINYLRKMELSENKVK